MKEIILIVICIVLPVLGTLALFGAFDNDEDNPFKH
jgi:hypothetical protein